jgi:hypothetical protein
MKYPTYELITLSTGTTIEVSEHSPDWFPMHIVSGLHNTTLYFRRAQLLALQTRLNEILDD